MQPTSKDLSDPSFTETRKPDRQDQQLRCQCLDLAIRRSGGNDETLKLAEEIFQWVKTGKTPEKADDHA